MPGLVVGVVGVVRVRACPEQSGRDQHAGVQSVCVVLLGEWHVEAIDHGLDIG